MGSEVTEAVTDRSCCLLQLPDPSFKPGSLLTPLVSIDLWCGSLGHRSPDSLSSLLASVMG